MDIDRTPIVSFSYEGRTFSFVGSATDDYMISLMKRIGGFYERDVLERLRESLGNRRNDVAIDAGAFMGTHAVFFASVCRCARVLAFEANAAAIPVLVRNIELNDVAGAVIPINKALGSRPGRARIVAGDAGNSGMTRVEYGAAEDGVEVTTIDRELERRPDGRVALIKIDVEGAELEVIKGAQKTIDVHSPLLCIEMHTTRNLLAMLARLRAKRYWIVDCLGYSPTYILEVTGVSSFRRSLMNALWLIRTLAPKRYRHHFRTAALRLYRRRTEIDL